MEDVDPQPLIPGTGGSIGIVGGGWAGMAAALELAQAGRHVHVFEAAPVLGGRARRVARAHPQVAGELDNGQHLLLGAYRHTLALMRRAGVDPDAAFLRLPLQMAYPDGWTLEAPRWPAPLHLLGMGLRARGISWSERAALARVLSEVRAGERGAQPQTVAAWLSTTPRTLRHRLWYPLCVAALNTPPEQADAAVFRRVLRDSVFAARSDSDMLVPRLDLSRVFPEAAANVVRQAGGTVATGATVRALSRDGARGHGWVVHTASGATHVDSVVIATAPRPAARLLAPLWEQASALAPTLAMLDGFAYAPIVTLHLNVGALRLPRPFLALDAGAQAPAQFVFDRAALGNGGAAHDNVWSVVISAADAEGDLEQPELARRVRAQLARQLAPCLPQADRLAQPRGDFVIAERHATFRCVPGLARPHNRTGVAGLLLAGDYTDGPYPATLEAAMLSGSAAAALCMQAEP
ncbi:hydroxysqualene dehydroxylase HpnE [Cupriavidus respiraculi]|uniref:hydroxysqualene dehydroxylase HpnE n=1 Tax=Cupriavidus respiraculi TaxID=195930 RepID=UPI001C97A777|nr:hydroxysqualene dehydroxylase HpnE [Cupriavidus respiraculi]MBY4945290.1 hydroxysqualene dehydroxylase HpnE [Cupriavidus respiraculi]